MKLGLEVGRIGIEALIEEVEALAKVEKTCKASSRLEAVILGVGDLSASQGMRLGHIGTQNGEKARYPGDIWHFARCRLIVAARAAGIDAIDGPYANFANSDAYERLAGTFSMLGGVGKWCIHPNQIAIANRVFAPSPEEITEAQTALAALADAEARGQGSASLNGTMIDAATSRIFQTVMDRAKDCGLVAP